MPPHPGNIDRRASVRHRQTPAEHFDVRGSQLVSLLVDIDQFEDASLV